MDLKILKRLDGKEQNKIRILRGVKMKCNYRPPKMSKEDRQELANLKSTLPYIDRMQIKKEIGVK